MPEANPDGVEIKRLCLTCHKFKLLYHKLSWNEPFKPTILEMLTFLHLDTIIALDAVLDPVICSVCYLFLLHHYTLHKNSVHPPKGDEDDDENEGAFAGFLN